jgi:hypothetical protein
MEALLAKLPDNYGQLLQRHAKLHGELFNRMPYGQNPHAASL